MKSDVDFKKIVSRVLKITPRGLAFDSIKIQVLANPTQRHLKSKISLLIAKLLKFNTELVFRGPKVPSMDISEGKIPVIDTVPQNKLTIFKNHEILRKY